MPSDEPTMTIMHEKQTGCLDGYEATDGILQWCNCPNGPQCVTFTADPSSTVADASDACVTCGRPW